VTQTSDPRVVALDAYLARRRSQGFAIETRTGFQAVIVRRRRLYFVVRWFARDRVEERLVVSVDQHGTVTSQTAQPLRW
jgi:hypothetical protein